MTNQQAKQDKTYLKTSQRKSIVTYQNKTKITFATSNLLCASEMTESAKSVSSSCLNENVQIFALIFIHFEL